MNPPCGLDENTMKRVWARVKKAGKPMDFMLNIAASAIAQGCPC